MENVLLDVPDPIKGALGRQNDPKIVKIFEGPQSFRTETGVGRRGDLCCEATQGIWDGFHVTLGSLHEVFAAPMQLMLELPRGCHS